MATQKQGTSTCVTHKTPLLDLWWELQGGPLRKVGLLPSCVSDGGTGTFLPPFVRTSEAAAIVTRVCESWWDALGYLPSAQCGGNLPHILRRMHDMLHRCYIEVENVYQQWEYRQHFLSKLQPFFIFELKSYVTARRTVKPLVFLIALPYSLLGWSMLESY
jgi:hypothetical protein